MAGKALGRATGAPADPSAPVALCPHCGAARDETIVKRGAVTITSDPVEVFWRGRRVPLSPTEAWVFRTIAIRGRASNEAIDRALGHFGSSPATRPVVMNRIGQHGVALKIAGDGQGSSATVIGLRLDAATLAELSHG